MTDQAQAFEQEVAEATPPMEETIEERKAKAREMVPVTPGQGITPENYQGFVTVAQGMAKAYLMLPPHLHDNVAVAIGVMDIASRARLSPYLLAMQTYVMNGRLCFMSMAFHALARPFLNGGLKGEYLGEGDEMRLVVRGRLKGDPAIYEHESPPLGQVRPPKNEGGMVKGSPLWQRKPRQQLWYDTTRDWVRRHCPEAVLGVRGDDEAWEEEELKDVTPPLRERLVLADRPATGEGFREGAHVEAEMAKARAPIQAAINVDEPADEVEQGEVRAGRQKAAGKPRPVQPPPAAKTRPRPPQAREKARQRKPKPPSQAEVKRAADRAEARAGLAKEYRPPRPTAKPPQAKSSPAAAYVAMAKAWIEAVADSRVAQERWLEEKDMRDEAQVPIADRQRLKDRLDAICDELAEKGK